MKLQELFEMSYRAGDLRQTADTYAAKLQRDFAKVPNHKELGEIDGMKVIEAKPLVGVFDGETLVCSMSFSKVGSSHTAIDDFWTMKERSGNRILSRMLKLFQNAGHKVLVVGLHHSDDTYNILKNNGFSSFTRTWIHRFTDDREPFSTDTIEKYYGDGDWKLELT